MTPSPECWDAAFDVARRYHEFDSYGTDAKAVRALHRRRPSLTPAEAAELFEGAGRLWRAAVALLADNSETLLRECQAGADFDLARFDGERERLDPVPPLSTWREALTWVWYWHYLR